MITRSLFQGCSNLLSNTLLMFAFVLCFNCLKQSSAYAQTNPPVESADVKTIHTTSEERYSAYLKFYTLIRGIDVQAHWYADGNRFWFATGVPDNVTIYVVDPEKNTTAELFDRSRLRAALSTHLGHELAVKGAPFWDFQ
ncbi:MAG: hypothetical protein K2P84_00960, partial [Undibacterium sp.]|nr:hypothetical protein [Undibacterium sp.]